MFGQDAMMKLMSNPKTAAYLMDPGFRQMFEMCKKNPQMLFEMMKFDPRFSEVL